MRKIKFYSWYQEKSKTRYEINVEIPLSEEEFNNLSEDEKKDLLSFCEETSEMEKIDSKLIDSELIKYSDITFLD